MCTGMVLAGAGSAIAGLFGASKSAKAAKQAAQIQAQSAREALAATKQMYETTRADLAPYRKIGENAKAGYENLLGTGDAGMEGIMASLEGTPGYQFALRQGLMATQSGFASKGLASSGAAIKGAGDYAKGLAETTYQNVLGNYYNALQLGSGAAAQTGQIGMGMQQQMNSAITGAGAAQASGVVGAANAWSGGINNAAQSLSNAFMTNEMFKQLAKG